MKTYYQMGSTGSWVEVWLSRDDNGSNDKRYVLNHMKAEQPGQGVGTTLLEAVLADADAENVTLILVVEPNDPKKYWRLRRWYLRHGFVGKRGHRNVMVRHPQG